MNYIARTPADIGHALRRARKEQNLTQRELASISGVWQETISKLENGLSGAKLDTVFDICAALDLELLVTNRSKVTSDFLEQ